MQPLAIGIDIGSTTVKAVWIGQANHAILWHDYPRHTTRQPQVV